MGARTSPKGAAVAVCTGLVAASAGFGAVGMVTGLLPLEPTMTSRLPLRSPVLAGLALAAVVGFPMALAAVLSWRRHPRAGDVTSLAGLALVGWIVVEVAVVRLFSPLQPACAAAGLGLMAAGNRAVLRQVADVALGLPLFVSAPLWRHWHLRWGATQDEVAAPMPGDALVPRSHFTATRAVTVDAVPEEVWPWLVQVGFGRAGFYSYDLLDNLGRPSASTTLPEWQHLTMGALAAPMANPPSPATSFVVAELDPPTTLLWAKPDSTWCWSLRPLAGGRTRLVTRLRQHYRLSPSTLLTVVLAELGDFPMMRRMLLGIKKRAEAARCSDPLPQSAGEAAATATTGR